MFSAREVALLRDVARRGMPGTVEILRPLPVELPGGGVSRTEVSRVGSTVCALRTSVSRTVLIGDAQRTEADAMLSMPGDTSLDVLPGDRLRVDGDQTYESMGYLEPSGPYSVTKRVLVSRV